MKLYIIKGILSLIILTCCQTFFAMEPQHLIKEGNELYKNGLYSQAASRYQTVIDSGYAAADLYYNAGNAYYKSRDYKNAILYYEKARLINPLDKELDYNLNLARSKTMDKIETIPDLFFIEWIRSFRDMLSMDFWAYLSIILLAMGLVGLLVYYFVYSTGFRKTGFYAGSAFLILALLSYSFASSAHSSQVKQRTAIIFIKAVTVKSTPSETGTNLFILHEGTKVKIVDKVDNWNKIKIPDGNQGWVKENDLAKI